MKLLIVLIAALAAALNRPTVAAARSADAAKFREFVRSDFHRHLLLRAFALLPPAVFRRCPTLVSNQSQVTAIRLVTFGIDGFPASGAWKESFPVSGCGNDTTINFYFVVGKGEKIDTLIALPGTTHGSLTLQRDASMYALMGGTLTTKGCKNLTITNTKFESYGLSHPVTPDPGPLSRLRPWWETWTMVGCGHKVEIPVDFVPDATGTQIDVPAKFATIDR